MLRINLLPSQKRAKVPDIHKEVVLYFLIVALLLIGMFFTQSWLQQKESRLTQIKQKKTAQKNSLLKKIGRINKMEKQLAEVKNKIEIIKKIRSRQNLPVRRLNEMVSLLPQDKLWYKSMQMNAKGRVSLNGVALDNQAFARYVQGLRGSEYIDNVFLGQTSRQKIRGLELVAFKCSVQTSDRP
jgi:type IV pilus assembly protein PilN